MPTMTLLEMVQDILSDMNSDPVDAITDTVESEQVSKIVRTTYNEIIDGRDWPHLDALFQLTASGDNALPTHMQIPAAVQYVKFINYNKKPAGGTKDIYTEITRLEPQDFLDKLNSRNSADSTVTSVTDTTGITFLIKNDVFPTYWTTFDEDFVIFDSHVLALDTTLVASKTQCWGPADAVFTLSDAFVPDLPANMFSYLLAEAKSTAFNTVKEQPNPKEEQRSARQARRASGSKSRTDGKISYYSVGRR